MKKLKLLTIICLMFIGIKQVCAFDNTLKIYDYAQVLTTSQEQKLKEKIDNYISNYQIDIILIDVRYHSKTTIEEYAKEFYNVNNFGIGINKDGILLVIDLSKNEKYIFTQGKANKIYDSNRINKILNLINLDEDYYSIFNTFLNNINEYANNGVDYSKYDTKISVNWSKIIIISIIIPSIIVIILILKNKMIHKKEDADYYLVDGSLVINIRDEKFITTHTEQTIIHNNNNKGGKL